jgi:hypothetical protein
LGKEGERRIVKRNLMRNRDETARIEGGRREKGRGKREEEKGWREGEGVEDIHPEARPWPGWSLNTKMRSGWCPLGITRSPK